MSKLITLTVIDVEVFSVKKLFESFMSIVVGNLQISDHLAGNLMLNFERTQQPPAMSRSYA